MFGGGNEELGAFRGGTSMLLVAIFFFLFPRATRRAKERGREGVPRARCCCCLIHDSERTFARRRVGGKRERRRRRRRGIDASLPGRRRKEANNGGGRIKGKNPFKRRLVAGHRIIRTVAEQVCALSSLCCAVCVPDCLLGFLSPPLPPLAQSHPRVPSGLLLLKCIYNNCRIETFHPVRN